MKLSELQESIALPLVVCSGVELLDAKGNYICSCANSFGESDRDHARYLVHAANNFGKLVEALELLLAAANHAHPNFEYLWKSDADEIKAALAAAKEVA